MPIDYVNGPDFFLTCPYGDDSPEEIFEQVKKILDENRENIKKKPWVVNFIGYKPTLDWAALERLAAFFTEYKIFKLAQYVPNNEYLAEQCRVLDTYLEAAGIPSRTFRNLKDIHNWLNKKGQGP